MELTDIFWNLPMVIKSIFITIDFIMKMDPPLNILMEKRFYLLNNKEINVSSQIEFERYIMLLAFI